VEDMHHVGFDMGVLGGPTQEFNKDISKPSTRIYQSHQ
jgi:hypothetical protein